MVTVYISSRVNVPLFYLYFMFLFNYDLVYLVSCCITRFYPCVSASLMLLIDGLCNYKFLFFAKVNKPLSFVISNCQSIFPSPTTAFQSPRIINHLAPELFFLVLAHLYIKCE